MTATLYLIRHATPDWSRTDIRYDIPPGPPLTAQGEAEAKLLGDFLKSVNVVHLYASPLERTTRTAQIAATDLGIAVETQNDLAEWVHGDPETNVLSRSRVFLDRALDESIQRGPLGLVTHGGPIRILLADLGLEAQELTHYRRLFDHDNPVPPAGAWKVTRHADGRIAIPQLVFTPQPFTPYQPVTVHV